MVFLKKENGEIGPNDNKPEIIDVEAEEVTDPLTPVSEDGRVKYVGQVVTVHNGYSYINKVKRGYETIPTNGDVFVPAEFPVGTWVEFEQLNSDPRRTGNKYRTENAIPIVNKMIRTDAGERSAVAIYNAMSLRTAYHHDAKKIDPEKVEKALKNEPLSEVVELHSHIMEDGKAEDIDVSSLAEGELKKKHSPLIPIGVSFSIDEDFDPEEDQAKINETTGAYEQNDMNDLAVTLRAEYEEMKRLRTALAEIKKMGALQPETIIPIKYLADLTVIAPVLFTYSKYSLEDNTRIDDPHFDHAVEFFCDCIGAKNYAWFYQMYNRRTRPLSNFNGRDVPTIEIMRIIEKAKQIFDYVSIFTPYHDIASKEWRDFKWLRNIDPFLFGFVKGLPYMFFLGRWSGTFFPMIPDMIADTIDHIRINRDLLANFAYNTYWYMGGDGTGSVLQNKGGEKSENTVLPKFADQIISAYMEGRLFQFLREEEPGTDLTT